MNLLCILAIACLIYPATVSVELHRMPLPDTSNETFLQGLGEILDSYRYTHGYEKRAFDCLDTSMITLAVLQEHGYEPELMARLTANKSHVWILVPDGQGAYAFVETTAFDHVNCGLGDIVPKSHTKEYNTWEIVSDPKAFLEYFGAEKRIENSSSSYQPTIGTSNFSTTKSPFANVIGTA